MKIGLIGSGGREHAIAKALFKTKSKIFLYSYADHLNPGINQLASSVFIGASNDIQNIESFFTDKKVDLVIVGPEVPLINGVSDKLRKKGIRVVGPTKAQARLEGDKVFMRNLLRRKVKIGSPRWQEVKNIASAQEFINTVKQAAIKPIGLTGGKGVRVMGVHFHSMEETLRYVDFLLEQDGVVLLEERLVGEEFSRIAFVSGNKIISTPVAQDFKYALDGDEGGMTGGMGAYTMANGSMPFLSKNDVDQADSILEATVKAIEEETGKEYRGFLYGQFIATANGVYVIEFNVRLGDPEAINLMTLLQADTVDVFTAIAENSLINSQVSFSPNASVCKYLVPASYPDNSKDKLKFDLALDEFERSDLSIIYASMVEEDGALYSLGSRTLAVVGLGENACDISDKIESLLEKYEPAELRHRKDIGDRHVIQLKTNRLNELRSKASQ